MAGTAYEANSYKIRAGTWNQVDMTAAYNVDAFPVQTDQAEIGWQWWPPMHPSGVLSEVDELVDALDGSRGGFGGWNGSWFIGPCTPDMITYLRSTLFSNGWSADVTITTWDRAYGWRVLNCKALWNDPAKTADSDVPWGYHKVKIDFVNGTVAAIGVAFSSAFSSAFDVL
jgi:hypothetical protein